MATLITAAKETNESGVHGFCFLILLLEAPKEKHDSCVTLLHILQSLVGSN